MRSRRWIRLDVTWEDSPWLDVLDGTTAGCWPRLLCLVKRDGVNGRCKRPNPSVLARRWRVTRDIVTALEAAAIADGALVVEDGEYAVVNWSKYQAIDPTATDRKRRQRGKQRGDTDLPGVTARSRTSRVTPVTTRDTPGHLSCATETETSQKKERASLSTKKGRAAGLPTAWQPNGQHAELARKAGVDLSREVDRFRDHAAATGRIAKDWDAAFRNWLRKAEELRVATTGSSKGRPRQDYRYENPSTKVPPWTR